MKSYKELLTIPKFDDRFEYLKLKSQIGTETFGSHRYLNQMLYKDPRWKSVRNQVIIRDNACDLAHADFDLGNQSAYVHHINPITIDDIINGNSKVFDLDNLVTCSFNTHQAIHFGTVDLLPSLPTERKPNDTCPWRK